MPIEIVVALLAQVIPIAAFLAHLSEVRAPSKLQWLLLVCAYGAYFLYTYLVCRWDWLGYYFRYAIPVVFLGLAVLSWRRASHSPWWPHAGWKHWQSLAFIALVLVVFIGFAGVAITGQFFEGTPVKLTFPLENGTYYVGQGGSSSIVNYHATNEAQQFALDIDALNSFGYRARGILPDALNAYVIYGSRVHSPCAGDIRMVVDELPEHTPPERDRDHPAGNHVIVRCNGVDVVLAHLQPGSIEVAVGDRVKTGRVLGLVGNSGNTTEPHLHIHAESTESAESQAAKGVPIVFGDRFLTRNSVFRR